MKNKLPQHLTDWFRFQSFLKDLLIFTTEIIDSLEGKKITYDYQRVLYKFIQRFHLNFSAIKNNWKDYLNNSKFKYPIFLLLRALISDYISMLYLIDGLKFEKLSNKPVEQEFADRYIELSNTYFKRLEREIEKLIAENKITAHQKEKFINNEREYYPEHFQIGGEPKVKKIADLNPGTIIRKLKTSDWEKLTGAYQYYFYFSQYEHFTIKTEEFFENDRNKEFINLTDSVNYLIRGLLINITMMQLNKELTIKLVKIINDFEDKFKNGSK